MAKDYDINHDKFGQADDRYGAILIFCLVLILAVVGYFLFGQFADYTYKSSRHVADLIRAKMWSITLVMLFSLIFYWKRNSRLAPAIAVLAVSIYFIVIYSILFRGTPYGMNGHWGDNGYRLAIICKIMAFGYPADAYIKHFTSMYPPLWFVIMALYGKLLGLAAWQTLKFGYLLIFLVYPWLIYFSWRPLVSSRAAAAVSVATIFFGHNYLYYIYYEHMSAALFLPWWLYFFEDGKNVAVGKRFSFKFYFVGALVGSGIFMTYYYWFFIAILALPLTLITRHLHERSSRDFILNLRHKAFLAIGVALICSPYWLPLLVSGFKYGFESSQVTWFGLYHADLPAHWVGKPLEGAMVLVGIFFAAYLWNNWNHARLALYYMGAILLIILDRAMNLGAHSTQTRKILEFTHVLTMAPLAIGVLTIWEKLREQKNIRYGLIALAMVIGVVFANDHTEIYRQETYKTGINQRLPEAELNIMRSADCNGTVFLTTKYIEACYLPYFMFTPFSNVPAHLAGRYRQRMECLKAASQITEPLLLAYIFAYNKYDTIDYVYLPYNASAGSYEFWMNTVSFNSRMVFDTISFSSEAFPDSTYFPNVYNNRIFEVKPSSRNQEIDALLKGKYPLAFEHMRPPDQNSGR